MPLYCPPSRIVVTYTLSCATQFDRLVITNFLEILHTCTNHPKFIDKWNHTHTSNPNLVGRELSISFLDSELGEKGCCGRRLINELCWKVKEPTLRGYVSSIDSLVEKNQCKTTTPNFDLFAIMVHNVDTIKEDKSSVLYNYEQ